jgi:hypothetical protein
MKFMPNSNKTSLKLQNTEKSNINNRKKNMEFYCRTRKTVNEKKYSSKPNASYPIKNGNVIKRWVIVVLSLLWSPS